MAERDLRRGPGDGEGLMDAELVPSVDKPLWEQRTFWISLAGMATAVAALLKSGVTPETALLTLAAVFGNLGSMTGRAGGVQAAERVLDHGLEIAECGAGREDVRGGRVE